MADDHFDVIILGTGPAGLQAAIHAVRAKVSVLVLGKQHKSSLYRAHIENFCCLSKIEKHCSRTERPRPNASGPVSWTKMRSP